MSKLLLSLFLVTIICSSTDAWAQRRNPIENGDVVLYLPKKLLADVVGQDTVEGKKVYKLQPVSEKTADVILSSESDIWDGNVVWTNAPKENPDGTFGPMERVMPEFINDAKGNLIYGDKAKWDKLPEALKELPPVEESPIDEATAPNPLRRNVGRFSGRPRPVIKQFADKIREETISRQQLIDKLLKENAELRKSVPTPGLTTKAKVVRVIDGDTVVVKIETTMHVRLLDCRMPELKTEQGVKAKEVLTNLIGDKDVIVEIPASKRGDLTDITSLSRFLGRVWLNDVNVSEYMNDWIKNAKEKK